MAEKKAAAWKRLDNAAKIFPPTSNKRDTKVFRFACQLNEPVRQEELQLALDRTIEAFPLFRCVLKHGLFWYYLEETSLKPVVEREYRPPCGPLYDPNSRNLLFEITYCRNRINLEIYHALTDGTGALQFLRTLVCHYLALVHPEDFTMPPLLDYDASAFQKEEDSFLKYYNPRTRALRKKSPRAYRIKGARLPEGRMKIIEGVMPVKEVLRLAKSYNATLTVFLTAAFLLAIGQEMAVRYRKRAVVLSVPVNLRNFFRSQTARNFFGVINVGYRFSDDGAATLEQVIGVVKATFDRELTEEQLSLRLNALGRAERNFLARAIPLVLKDLVLRCVNYRVQRETTGSLSNIGRISMPEETIPYIRQFDVFVSTDQLQACVCSFQEDLVVSFTSAFQSTDIQKRFFRILTGAGVPVEIASNLLDGES